MPRYIVKLVDKKENKDYYMEWSTVVDAPVTYGMGLEEFKAYYKDEYGKQGMDGLDERLTRVNEKGTSAMMYDSAEDLIEFNRAGKDGTCLTFEQIIAEYCIPKAYILGYPFGADATKENLVEYKDKEHADFNSEEWCVVYAFHLEDAKDAYEDAFIEWQKSEQEKK